MLTLRCEITAPLNIQSAKPGLPQMGFGCILPAFVLSVWRSCDPINQPYVMKRMTVWFQSEKKKEGYESSHLRQENSNIRPYLSHTCGSTKRQQSQSSEQISDLSICKHQSGEIESKRCQFWFVGFLLLDMNFLPVVEHARTISSQCPGGIGTFRKSTHTASRL
jgi:hypothetical protein